MDEVLALLRRHGWNSTSFQILEPGFRIRLQRDGCVAWVETSGARVAAGGPVAPEEELARHARSFVRDAARAGRRACFFAVEDRFVEATGWPALQIGEQPVWDPRRWPQTLAASRSLREQLRRARAKNVRVRRLSSDELIDARPELEAITGRWLASRRMAPMGFLVQVRPFDHPSERRVWVAERDERIVAFLVAAPVYARRGWLLENLVRDHGAPNGTSELLVDAGFRDAAEAGCEWATLGLAPLSGAPRLLRFAGRLGSRLYDFDGLRAFKARLRPTRWDPIHLAWPPGVPAARALLDALAAFARGGLLRFAFRTALHLIARPFRGDAYLWSNPKEAKMAKERDEKRQYHAAPDEQAAEEKRLHPDYLKNMPPAPPEVVASHHEGTRKEEAGHLPESEDDRRG